MGMPLPGGERGQGGGADGGVQAAVASPMSAFVFGSRAIVTAIGADDCRQGLQMGRRGISAWRTRQRRAGRTAGRTRHQWRQMGSPGVDIKGVAPSDGLDDRLPGELETDVGWASLAKLAMSLTTTQLFALSEGPQVHSGSPLSPGDLLPGIHVLGHDRRLWRAPDPAGGGCSLLASLGDAIDASLRATGTGRRSRTSGHRRRGASPSCAARLEDFRKDVHRQSW